MTGDEKLLKKGGIDKTKAVFLGAFEATPEQLTPKKEGEPPSQASLNLVDHWIAIMEARVAELKKEEEAALFDEVRAHKHE
jgi:hypothetical protein